MKETADPTLKLYLGNSKDNHPKESELNTMLPAMNYVCEIKNLKVCC